MRWICCKLYRQARQKDYIRNEGALLRHKRSHIYNWFLRCIQSRIWYIPYSRRCSHVGIISLRNETFANALNSRMCAEHKSTPIIASVRINDARWQKLLRSFPKVVNIGSKKFRTDYAIVKFVEAILRYMQSSKMKTQHYADNLDAKCCNYAVYDEETLHEVFIQGGGASRRHCLQWFWAQNPPADLSD